MGLQKLRQEEGGLAVSPHAQLQGGQSQGEQVGVEGRQASPQVPEGVAPQTGCQSSPTEGLGKNHAVIGRIGSRKLGPAAIAPVKVASVHHHSAENASLPREIFGGGVEHGGGAPFQRATEGGGSKGVVHHQGHPPSPRHVDELLQRSHIQHGVSQRFGKKSPGLPVHGLFHLGGRIGVDQARRHTEPGKEIP